MNCSISQKNRIQRFNSIMTRHEVPTENCVPFMDAWLQCIDTKDNCCGGKKCKFFFTEWQNCHKYNNEVRVHNKKMANINPGGVKGTFNGLSAK